MDPLFSFQDSTGAFDFGAAFGSTAQQDNGNSWFQNDAPKNSMGGGGGKPNMFDLSSAISGFESAHNGSSAAAQSNSLNQLLSQHLDAQAQAQAHHHHQSQLAALFSDDHMAPTPIRAPAAQLPSLQNHAGNSHNNNGVPSMFVATLVDPNQEGAVPQQMLFLPGTNQVIPMSGANEGQLLNLADMPVVFQNQQNNNVFHQDATLASLAASVAPTPLSALRSMNMNMNHHMNMQQQQQQHQMAAVLQTKPQEAKKPEANMPVRPLSAYNFFFSDERERILKGEDPSAADHDDYDDAKKQHLLVAHLAKDRTKRRPHRKTHGKINFTTLSKLIGQRWRQLSDDRKNFYRQVAAIDLERYQRELRERGAGATASGI